MCLVAFTCFFLFSVVLFLDRLPFYTPPPNATEPSSDLYIYYGFIALSGVACIVHAIAAAKTYICVCEDCIFGVAARIFFTEEFESTYDKVSYVAKDTDANLYFSIDNKIHKCYISNAKEAKELIKAKVNEKGLKQEINVIK
jgi:hypothetical protein